jgi:hypothetical protein
VRAPLSLRAARIFLGLLAVAWAWGVLGAAGHLVNAIAQPESAAELMGDARAVLERILLMVAACASVWAIGRRKPIGRWSTVGLGTLVLFRWLPMLAQPWRGLHGDFSAPRGQAAYSSPTEALIGLIIQCLLLLLVLTLIGRVALADNVTEYFKSTDSPSGGIG